MEKRGLGHVEMIISFLIFLGFVGFALYFFNPIDTKRLVDSSVYYVNDEIIKNVTTTLNVSSVVIGSTVPVEATCVSFDFNRESVNARVEDQNGDKINSKYENDKITADVGTKKFLRVMLSEEFPVSTASCSPIVPATDITISSNSEKEVLSERKLLILNDSYFADYVKLKEDFNLPGRIDFGFAINFDDGRKIDSNRPVPEGLDVFSSSKRVEVLRNTGSDVGKVEFAELVVKIW